MAFAVFAALLSSAMVFSFPGIGTRSGLNPFSTSMPSFFSGRSMMCPTVALTRYPRPRYLPMVFALAGDSTMTSDEPPAPSAPLSISVTTVFFVRFRPAVFRAAMSVHRFRTFRARCREAGTLDQRAQIVERDAPVDLHQSALDEL